MFSFLFLPSIPLVKTDIKGVPLIIDIVSVSAELRKHLKFT